MSLLKPPTVLLALACFLGSQAAVHAQTAGVGDPRDTEDPRRISDPRRGEDPRDADVKPGIEESLQSLRGPDLFDELWRDGNIGALSSAMAEDSWGLTDYIFDQAGRWLGRTGSHPGEPDTESKELEAKVREIARLADSRIGDTRFSYNVNTIFALTIKERVVHEEQVELFKQGSALMDLARSSQETLRALTPLRQSLSRALLIEDIRAQALCYSLIGRVQILNRNSAEARASGKEAVRLGRTVRDLDTVWNGLATVMQASLLQNDFSAAKLVLQEQYQLAVVVGDELTAEKILFQLIELDRALGKNLPGGLVIFGPRLDRPIPGR